ncbi:PLP-dependent aminotransferase family protein [Sorangium sp. So ce861]|uniref:MocR-like pyridoxine biosynthesis transcription factor PdxR n=1 Tax=Sorangium sp. So ce861 TaxID=3133323 RepID=UPI003F630EBF
MTRTTSTKLRATSTKAETTATKRPRRASPPAGAVTAVALDPASSAPLHRQVYEAVRGAILAGRLRSGSKLPSTRALAAHLGLSRNTALGAYAQLLSEGYLRGRIGSGTYVADALPERLLLARPRPEPRPSPSPGDGALSRRGALVAGAASPFRRAAAPLGPAGWAFQVGVPAFDAFPAAVWGRLMSRRWDRSWRALVPRCEPQGYAPLRRAIADYLVTARGVRCTPDQVIVVGGAQQAISLAAEVLLDPGDPVWVEDPGYTAARSALVAAGATPVPVPVDEEGLDVAAALRGLPARLAVVTPSHQFPLGVTMSLGRRLALLDWARSSGGWVFEDDYDSEFRYAGRPLAALQGQSPGARVIYAGTFSKVLSPSLRLGYLVVPEGLVDAFVAAKALADVSSPSLEQAVLSDFMAEGHFARHVRRMRVLYERRQAALVAAAERELRGLLEVRAAPAGMHLLGWLPAGRADGAAAERAAANGVRCVALSELRVRSAGRGALVLGYAAAGEDEIDEGVRRLRAALR